MTQSKLVPLLLILLVSTFLLGVLGERSGFIEDIIFYQEDIIYLTIQHITLTLLSGGFAILIAIPLGIWLSRPYMSKWSETLMQPLNIMTTVPTLAILALSMSFLGIGTLPALFALWLATLLPIVRNTYAGLKSVPSFFIESANGMGMPKWKILISVELPNALFVIFAGIRTAIAINIGTVPLAFLIGAGGLGELIFTGIDMDEMVMMLAGAIPVALLAIFVDFILSQIQYWLIPRGVNPLR